MPQTKVPSTYQEKDEFLKEFLQKKGFHVVSEIGDESRGTHTYNCESDGMPYVVKIGIGTEENKTRLEDLRNEVIAVTKLWKYFQNGEAKNFMLPPGPETIFDEEEDGFEIYGYARFYIEGSVLGLEMRAGSQSFSAWMDRFVEIVNEIANLPVLDLPRTEQKRGTDFKKVIDENTEMWVKKLAEYLEDEDSDMSECVKKVGEEVHEYFEKNEIPIGTIHRELIPDHIIYDTMSEKPYLLNYTKLCQHYPKHMDAAMVYSWISVVLGDVDIAREFWDKCMESVPDDEKEYAKMIRNEIALGVLWDYLDPEKEAGELKVGCDLFL